MNDLLNHLKHYGDVMETLRGDTVDHLTEITAEDIEFKDPFNHHQTRGEMIQIFKRMFEKLPGIRLEVTDFGFLTRSENTGFLTWIMYDTAPKSSKPLTFEGTSLVTFNEDGLAISHIDHWDAASQFYERFPVVGPLIRLIKKCV
ncbi:MAG: DUF2358 domain-containing protein [Alphaproteobacteria bacterium]|nr:MAG: DUF2358 domain-containing protein [Alphaproteobacteria bacterium]